MLAEGDVATLLWALCTLISIFCINVYHLPRASRLWLLPFLILVVSTPVVYFCIPVHDRPYFGPVVGFLLGPNILGWVLVEADKGALESEYRRRDAREARYRRHMDEERRLGYERQEAGNVGAHG